MSGRWGGVRFSTSECTSIQFLSQALRASEQRTACETVCLPDGILTHSVFNCLLYLRNFKMIADFSNRAPKQSDQKGQAVATGAPTHGAIVVGPMAQSSLPHCWTKPKADPGGVVLRHCWMHCGMHCWRKRPPAWSWPLLIVWLSSVSEVPCGLGLMAAINQPAATPARRPRPIAEEVGQNCKVECTLCGCYNDNSPNFPT